MRHVCRCLTKRHQSILEVRKKKNWGHWGHQFNRDSSPTLGLLPEAQLYISHPWLKGWSQIWLIHTYITKVFHWESPTPCLFTSLCSHKWQQRMIEITMLLLIAYRLQKCDEHFILQNNGNQFNQGFILNATAVRLSGLETAEASQHSTVRMKYVCISAPFYPVPCQCSESLVFWKLGILKICLLVQIPKLW